MKLDLKNRNYRVEMHIETALCH